MLSTSSFLSFIMDNSHASMTKICILIVDDQPSLRHVLHAYLRPLHWINIVGEVSTGQEAIDTTRAVAPDIALMDSHLPDMSGIYATKNILHDRPRIHVIFCSEERNSLMMQEAFDPGAQGFIWKATNGIELENAIRRVQNGNQYIDPVFRHTHQKSTFNQVKGNDPNALSR